MRKSKSSENSIRHLVFLFENAILSLPEGQEQMTWLLELVGFSMSTNISVKASRDIIHILQNHYPERLGVVIFYNPPRIFEAFFKVMRHFLDPKTAQKVKFVYPNNKDSTVELMNSLFDSENFPSEFGGKATLKYDHEEFSILMPEDVKTAQFWGLVLGQGNNPCGMQLEKERSCVLADVVLEGKSVGHCCINIG